jgi:hypothetical protein
LWNFNFSKFYALLKILILLIFLDFIFILFIVYSLIFFMKLIFLFNLTLQSKIIYFLSCFVFKYNPLSFNCYYFFLIFFCNFFFNFNLSHLIYWNLGFEIFTGLVLLVKWPWSRVHIVFFNLFFFLISLIDDDFFLRKKRFYDFFLFFFIGLPQFHDLERGFEELTRAGSHLFFVFQLLFLCDYFYFIVSFNIWFVENWYL